MKPAGGLRLRSVLRDEQGMALPTALIVMVVSFALASAAIFSSVVTQRGTGRDHDSKEAIAAADAGASLAQLRLNRFANALNSSTPCLGESGGILVFTGVSWDGWCPAIAGSVGGATYSYRVTPWAGSATISAVSTGTSGSVSRRIDVTLKGSSVGSVLAAEGVIGQEGITLGGNADIRVGVGTDGNVEAGGNAAICGSIRHGVGKEWKPTGNASQCSGYAVTEGNVSLPPVSSFMPTEIAAENSNFRLLSCTSTDVPPGCQSDTFSGKWKGNRPFDPSTRTISLSGNDTLTLGGGDYWLCRLTLAGNEHLVMANGAMIRIFFDTPENCGVAAGESQLSFTGNSSIEATGYEAELGQFDMPGLYLLGSPAIRASAILAGNSGTNELIVYGPDTDIRQSGNASYKGVIAGRTIEVSGNGEIGQDAGFEPPEIGGVTLYSRQSYVECTGATATVPSANC